MILNVFIESIANLKVLTTSALLMDVKLIERSPSPLYRLHLTWWHASVSDCDRIRRIYAYFFETLRSCPVEILVLLAQLVVTASATALRADSAR